MLKFFKKSELQQGKWSGGTTTELYIFPETARFGNDRFDFRISLATVDVMDTVYTPFPGIMRNLTVLDGTIDLYDRTEKISLQAGDTFIFSGDSTITCHGLATNFNILYDPRAYNVETAFIERANKSITIEGFTLIYPVEGEVQFKYNGESYFLEPELYCLISNSGELEIRSNGRTLITCITN